MSLLRNSSVLVPSFSLGWVKNSILWYSV